MAYLSESGKRSNSLLYLALICLLIFLLKSYNRYLYPSDENAAYTGGKIYVEIDDGSFSTVKVLENREELSQIEKLYNIDSGLKNGFKVVLDDGKKVRTGRISGLKSISLGIPIGINSANAQDLEALPGIGEKLALRIVAYRNRSGWFKNTDDLLNVNGMGDKKLALVKPYISLD